MVYSCLVLLFLLIPAERFPAGRRGAAQILVKIVCFCFLLAVSAGSIAAVNASIIRGYAAASQADASAVGTVSETTGQAITEGAVVTGEGEVLRSGFTVSELVHRPFFIFRMVCSTFSLQSGEMIGDMMGMRLGNLDPLLGIPFFLALLFLLGLMLLSLKTETGGSDPQTSEAGEGAHTGASPGASPGTSLDRRCGGPGHASHSRCHARILDQQGFHDH